MEIKNLYAESEKQLKRDEDVKLTIYYDTLNIPTIGIGFNLKEGFSLEEIELIFNLRWNNYLKELLQRCPWASRLDEARLGALMNMAYNMGVPRLLIKNPKTLALMAEGKFVEASQEVLIGLWHSQVGARARRISKQIETGEWQ